MSRDVRLEEGRAVLTHYGHCARCGRSSLGRLCRTCSKNPHKPFEPPPPRAELSRALADQARVIPVEEEEVVATERTCENTEFGKAFTGAGRYCSRACNNRHYYLKKVGSAEKRPRTKAPPQEDLSESAAVPAREAEPVPVPDRCAPPSPEAKPGD